MSVRNPPDIKQQQEWVPPLLRLTNSSHKSFGKSILVIEKLGTFLISRTFTSFKDIFFLHQLTRSVISLVSHTAQYLIPFANSFYGQSYPLSFLKLLFFFCNHFLLWGEISFIKAADFFFVCYCTGWGIINSGLSTKGLGYLASML